MRRDHGLKAVSRSAQVLTVERAANASSAPDADFGDAGALSSATACPASHRRLNARKTSGGGAVWGFPQGVWADILRKSKAHGGRG